MARSHVLLSTALGLGLSLTVPAAEASVDDITVTPVHDHQPDAEFRILPLGAEPESLGADDGSVNLGDGGDSGVGGDGGEIGNGGEGGEGGEIGDGGETGDRGDDEYTPPAAPPENPETDNFPLGTGLTNTVVTNLTTGGEACGLYDRSARIDCVRDELARAARELPRTGDYAEMRRALETASSKLDQIVMQNVDRTAPVTRYRAPTSKGPRTSATPIRRIAPQNAERANRQATVVMEELQTTLLRSASSSARKQVHFERAAQAVDSMKVLLRSS